MIEPLTWTFQGDVVGTADIGSVITRPQGVGSLGTIIIRAKHFLVDTDLAGAYTLPGVNIVCFAPYWWVQGGIRRICLKGSDNHEIWPAPANHGTQQHPDGADGHPGRPGYSGGHFYGDEGTTFSELDRMQIDIQGGRGAQGQNGGNAFGVEHDGVVPVIFHDPNPAYRIEGAQPYFGQQDISFLLNNGRRALFTLQEPTRRIQRILSYLTTFASLGLSVPYIVGYQSPPYQHTEGQSGRGGRGGYGGRPGSARIINSDWNNTLSTEGIRGIDGAPGQMTRTIYRGFYVEKRLGLIDGMNWLAKHIVVRDGRIDGYLNNLGDIVSGITNQLGRILQRPILGQAAIGVLGLPLVYSLFYNPWLMNVFLIPFYHHKVVASCMATTVLYNCFYYPWSTAPFLYPVVIAMFDHHVIGGFWREVPRIIHRNNGPPNEDGIIPSSPVARLSPEDIIRFRSLALT